MHAWADFFDRWLPTLPLWTLSMEISKINISLPREDSAPLLDRSWNTNFTFCGSLCRHVEVISFGNNM